MYRLTILTTVICLTFGVCIGGALQFGRSQPLAPRLANLHLTECAPPCWLGIIPGKTTVDDANKIIIARYGNLGLIDSFNKNIRVRLDEGNYSYTWIMLIHNDGSNGSPDIVNFIEFGFDESETTVMDLQSILGAPEAYVTDGNGTYKLSYLRKHVAIQGALSRGIKCRSHLTTLHFFSSNVPYWAQESWQTWRGNISAINPSPNQTFQCPLVE